MKNKGRVVVLFLICLIFIPACVATVMIFNTKEYINTLDEKLYESRKKQLIEVNIQNSLMVSNIIERYWNIMYTCENLLIDGDSDSDINQKVLYMRNYLDESLEDVVLIDNENRYYSSNGLSGVMQKGDIPGINEKKVAIAKEDRNENDSVFFTKKLKKEFDIAGVGVKYVVITVSLSEIIETMYLDHYYSSGSVFLIDSNGKCVYRNDTAKEKFGDFLFPDSIAGFHFLKGATYEDLINQYLKGEKTAYEIEINSERNFLSTTKINNADFTIVYIVESDTLSTSAAWIMKKSSRYFENIAKLVILAVTGIMVVVGINIHNRQRQKTEAENNKRLSELNIKLEEATRQAETANKAKSDFLSNISHDMRTPINGIIGMTSVAMKNVGNDEKTMDCLEKINGSTKHLLMLINNVLDMSRIEAGMVVISRKKINIFELLGNCVSIISGQLDNRTLDFETDFSGIIHTYIISDTLHLCQIIINVLGNSVKFTPDGGKIIFRVKETFGTDNKIILDFYMEDNGIGIKEEFMPMLFDAFAQEDGETRTSYNGSGLGMAITKRLVDLLDGEIKVESRVDFGTKFYIRIPCEIAVEQNQDDDIMPQFYDVSGMKVLIADDNPLNLEVFDSVLSEAGAKVYLAENGAAAYEEYMKNEPGFFDVILMDIMMPEMDGYEATAKIRNSGRNDSKTVPIVAVTARAFDNDVRAVADAGMNAHVSKPVEPDKLISCVGSFKNDIDRNANPLDGLKVLVADDSVRNAMVVKELLEIEGAGVVTAGDGEEAVKIFCESQVGEIGLILMDMRMPKLSGTEAAKKIRALERSDSKTVIIFAVTGNCSPENMEETRDAGMDAHITKPFDMNDLKEELNRRKRW